MNTGETPYLLFRECSSRRGLFYCPREYLAETCSLLSRQREALGLKVSEAATAAGISAGKIHNWEGGAARGRDRIILSSTLWHYVRFMGWEDFVALERDVAGLLAVRGTVDPGEQSPLDLALSSLSVAKNARKEEVEAEVEMAAAATKLEEARQIAAEKWEASENAAGALALHLGLKPGDEMHFSEAGRVFRICLRLDGERAFLSEIDTVPTASLRARIATSNADSRTSQMDVLQGAAPDV